MPRKKLITSDLYPYHITARTNNREPFPISLQDTWRIFELESYLLRILHHVEFQSLVLMPNHFHAIITTPEKNLGDAMSTYLSNITKSMNAFAGRSGHVFGGPYHWSLITTGRYFGHALKYVYRNPVRANLCKNVEHYPYSTLHGRLGYSNLEIPLHYTRLGMETLIPDSDNHTEWLKWLNLPFKGETEKWIGDRLKKKEMKKMISKSSRLINQALDELL